MGHLVNIKAEYQALRQRLDQGPAAAPPTAAMYEVLRQLFTEEEARLAAAMPWQPVSAARLARRLGEPEDRIRARLERMADRGVVFDLHDERTGKTRYVLSPPIVGFVEFSMMRVRDDIDQPAMARTLHELHGDRATMERFFAPGEAQIGRTLVHEDALDEADFAEVLDWERATRLIETSGGGALSLCYCRHVGEHLGEPCDKPVEICTSLQPSADYVIRRGFGRPASVTELLEVLAQARELGLVQLADNVQRNPMYICHCCSCHCQQLQAISRFGLKHAVRTSNRIAAVDPVACTGCGLCVKRCPVGALSLVQLPPAAGQPGRTVAQVDESLCLGCGVCHRACRKDALTLPARAERVLTPRSTLERILLRALERGSVHHLLFGTEESRTMAFLHRFLGVVERLPVTQRLLLSRTLKSRFLEAMVQEGQRRGGDVL